MKILKIVKRNKKDFVLDKYLKENGDFVDDIKTHDKVVYICEECGKESSTEKVKIAEPITHLICGNCRKSAFQKKNKEAINNKRKKTFIKKYGVENAMHLDSSKKKQAETNLQKYDTKVSSKNAEVKKKQIETNLQKYGGNSPSCNAKIQDKKRATTLKNFNVECPSQSKEIQQKTIETNLKKYGTRRPFQSNKVKAKYFRKNFEILKSIKNENFEFVDENFEGTKTRKYKWKCKKCENIFEYNIANGSIPRCPHCYPKGSFAEQEIVEFIKKNTDTEIITNSREIISPLELDIYLPEFNFAIEFNGLYWHMGKDKDYHLNKTLKCQKLGITLFHIFEDEWRCERAIIENLILSKISKVNKIYGRQTEVREISKSQAKNFQELYHLQGGISSKVNIGLFHNNILIAVGSFSSSRYNANYEWEITRFCFSKNVIGGFAKIISYFEKNYNPKSIISYADKRFFSGSIYQNNGFNLSHSSRPSYFYTDGNRRYNRVSFQKHKLKEKLVIFNEDLTEKENMLLNGYDYIYDCGTDVFVKICPEERHAIK